LCGSDAEFNELPLHRLAVLRAALPFGVRRRPAVRLGAGVIVVPVGHLGGAAVRGGAAPVGLRAAALARLGTLVRALSRASSGGGAALGIRDAVRRVLAVQLDRPLGCGVAAVVRCPACLLGRLRSFARLA